MDENWLDVCLSLDKAAQQSMRISRFSSSFSLVDLPVADYETGVSSCHAAIAGEAQRHLLEGLPFGSAILANETLESRRPSVFSLAVAQIASAIPFAVAQPPMIPVRTVPPVTTANLEVADDVPFLSPASEAPEDAFFNDEEEKPEKASLVQDEQKAPGAEEDSSANDSTKPSKIYRCPECPKTYTTTEGLRLHTRGKHLNDRNSVCTHCGRGFVRHSDLKLHIMRIHEEKRPFECTEWFVFCCPLPI